MGHPKTRRLALWVLGAVLAASAALMIILVSGEAKLHNVADFGGEDTNVTPMAGEAEVHKVVDLSGEDMNATPIGAGEEGWDPTVGRYMAIWSNAEVTGAVLTTEPVGEVVLRTRGVQCEGAPQATVSVDGVKVMSESIESTAWTDYVARTSLPAGTQPVEIDYTNDHYVDPSCDRNLMVDKVLLIPESASANDKSASANDIVQGAFVAGAPNENPLAVDDFKYLTGRYPKLLMWYEHWDAPFSAAEMEVAYSRGVEPIVTWEPWLADESTTLDQIVNGSKDTYIRNWAEAAKRYGKRIYLRPMHEMNGDWYPWSCRKRGTTNTPAKYREAFRHIYTIFQNAGATNVKFVWSPNIKEGMPSTLSECYPGNRYTDWLGMDGYNWGTSRSWSSWQSMRQIFQSTYDRLVTFSPTKPIMIAETASTEHGGNKASWIKEGYLSAVPTYMPRVKAIVWFNENKETDWRVNSSQASLDAYKHVSSHLR